MACFGEWCIPPARSSYLKGHRWRLHTLDITFSLRSFHLNLVAVKQCNKSQLLIGHDILSLITPFNYIRTLFSYFSHQFIWTQRNPNIFQAHIGRIDSFSGCLPSITRNNLLDEKSRRSQDLSATYGTLSTSLQQKDDCWRKSTQHSFHLAQLVRTSGNSKVVRIDSHTWANRILCQKRWSI